MAVETTRSQNGRGYVPTELAYAQALTLEAALPPEFALIGIDLKDPRNDGITLGIIRGATSIEGKVAATRFLGRSVLETKSGVLLDQDRVGPFLKIAAEVKKDKDAPQELKDEFDRLLSGSVLHRVAVEAAQQRWSFDNSQSAAEGYTRYMTLEKEYGKDKASKRKKKIAEELIYAREFDLKCAAETYGKPIIDLPIRGNEVGTVITKLVAQEVADELGVKEGVDPYYRDTRVLGYDREFGKGGKNRGIPSPEEKVSELLHRVGGPRIEAGVDLPTGGGKVDDDGDVREGLGKGQVGGLVSAGVGLAIAWRMRAGRDEGKITSESVSSDALRKVHLQKTGFRIITFGDGATSKSAVAAMDDASINRAPAMFLCNDNGTAIGTNTEETHGDTPISELGRGYGIPGITVESIDYEEVRAAVKLGSLWTALDKGPFFLHLKTERIAAHSPSHGHNKIPPIIDAVQEILSDQLDRETLDDRARVLEEFLVEGVYAPSLGDTTIAARTRIKEFVSTFELDDDIAERIEDVVVKIIDPLEVVLDTMKTEGVITDKTIEADRLASKTEIDGIFERVKAKEGPSVETVGKYIAMPFPEILIRKGSERVTGRFENGRGLIEVPYSTELVTFKGGEAIADALRAGRDDWAFSNSGIDANKGKEVYRNRQTRKYDTVQRGGYHHENDEVESRNTRIYEDAEMASAGGRFLQWAGLVEPDFYRQIALMNGDASYPQTYGNSVRRGFFNWDYSEYGIGEAFGSWLRDGGVTQLTSGNLILPVHAYMHEGMQGVGGPWHCHSMELATVSLPEGIDVFTVSTPEMAHKLLTTLRRFGNNPSITLWARQMWDQSQTWEKGTGLFEPGSNRVIREGKDLQIITYGQARHKVEDAANKASDSLGGASVGVIEINSWRQREAKHRDLIKFLSSGDGPIYIVTEEPRSRSAANLIASWLTTEPGVRDVAVARGRRVELIGSADVSYPYSAPELIEDQRPGLEYLQHEFLWELYKAAHAAA